MRIYFALILILLSGCQYNDFEIEVTDMETLEKWINSEVFEIFFGFDGCIKDCDINGVCIDDRCFSGCSHAFDREISNLTFRALDMGRSFDPEMEPGTSSGMIFELIEFNESALPRRFIDCQLKCHSIDCIDIKCYNNCGALLR